MTGGRPVFITRPADQAAGLAAAVQTRGFVPVLAPCLTLKINPGPPLDGQDIGAFAVTSANGVAALLSRGANLSRRVFAVGEATAAAARAGGFASVTAAGGDARSLAELVAGQVAPGGTILHASGKDLAFDLAGALSPLGIRVRVETVYSMPVADRLPDAALAVLDDVGSSAALLMSARTAAAFGSLVAASGRRLAWVDAVCLSPAVANAAAAHGFRSLATATAPNVSALLDMLEAQEGGL